jgi:ankyrin repeat and BTB/POZ domain-containing protein 1
MMTILRKNQLEASLHEEKKLIEAGRLKDENPLDSSEDFSKLCEACRRGDLKTCQEIIMNGLNINARDQFDYTPLILVIAPQLAHFRFLLEQFVMRHDDG